MTEPAFDYYDSLKWQGRCHSCERGLSVTNGTIEEVDSIYVKDYNLLLYSGHTFEIRFEIGPETPPGAYTLFVDAFVEFPDDTTFGRGTHIENNTLLY